MPPHVRRGGARGRSNTPRHAAQARADLSAGRSAPRTQGKFAAFDEFCKRLIHIIVVAKPIAGLTPCLTTHRDEEGLRADYAGIRGVNAGRASTPAPASSKITALLAPQ